MTARLMVVRLFCLLRSTWSEEIEIVCCHNKRLCEKKIRKKNMTERVENKKALLATLWGRGRGDGRLVSYQIVPHLSLALANL